MHSSGVQARHSACIDIGWCWPVDAVLWCVLHLGSHRVGMPQGISVLCCCVHRGWLMVIAGGVLRVHISVGEVWLHNTVVVAQHCDHVIGVRSVGLSHQ